MSFLKKSGLKSHVKKGNKNTRHKIGYKNAIEKHREKHRKSFDLSKNSLHFFSRIFFHAYVPRETLTDLIY